MKGESTFSGQDSSSREMGTQSRLFPAWSSCRSMLGEGSGASSKFLEPGGV